MPTTNTDNNLMKNVKYTGPKVNLGRFGTIEKGKKLRLTEEEFDKIGNDPRFELLDTPNSASELALFATIRPLGTGGFDLRTVPWENPNLFNILLARSSKSRLLLILSAIYKVGGDAVVVHSEHDDRLWLVDRVVEVARKMGWTKMLRSERIALPVFTESAPVPAKPTQAPDKDTAPTRRRRSRAVA